jgi:hypothetical protein
MMNTSLRLMVGATCLLASCQQTSKPDASVPNATEQAAPEKAATGAPTAADAQAAVGRYLQSQPNAALYVLDSARVNDNEATWQVLVPRTDWAQRMPNRARFEVDKATGAVQTAPVK